MKFSVKCLVSSVNAGELPEADSVVKDIVVANPNATLLNLRAAASVQFRLQVHGFRIMYKGDRADVDLSDEKQTLTAAGLRDGDALVLVSKRARAEGDGDDHGANPPASTTTTTTAGSTSVLRPGEDLLAGAADTGDEEASDEKSFHTSDAGDDDFGDDGMDELEAVGNGELYGRILEVTPNLISMREEFLQDPRALMERIQREDPSLFQLITTHQEDFVALINDEVLVRTLQQEKEAQQAFLDEEFDEEQEEALLSMLAQQIQADGGMMDGDDDEEGDLIDIEAEEGLAGSGSEETALGPSSSDKQVILAFAPSTEDEAKIQNLTQLGFSYEQCKLAFYMCHRSVERAANMLFESPPTL